jgi:excisionase family DNA binding protein
LLNLGHQGSRLDRLVPYNQRAARPHSNHETAGEFDAANGASETRSGEGEGLGHGAGTWRKITMTKLLLNVEEAGELANVGPGKIREEIRAGRLAARRLGKRVLVTLDDLRAYIDALPRAIAA